MVIPGAKELTRRTFDHGGGVLADKNYNTVFFNENTYRSSE